MPLVNFDTREDFDAQYRFGAEPEGHPPGRSEIKLGYTRAMLWEECRRRAERLVNLFGWSVDTGIVIIGAGFGWTGESLEQDFGYRDVWQVDSSSWVLEVQDKDEMGDIYHAIKLVGLDPRMGEGLDKAIGLIARGGGPGPRRRSRRPILKSLEDAGDAIRVALTEHLLPCLSDPEILGLISQIKSLGGGIRRFHLTGESGGPEYNWRSLWEWKELLPFDTFTNSREIV